MKRRAGVREGEGLSQIWFVVLCVAVWLCRAPRLRWTEHGTGTGLFLCLSLNKGVSVAAEPNKQTLAAVLFLSSEG